jgi:hypothetical protein
MEAEHFDSLVKTLHTRRSALGVAAGLGALFELSHQNAAQARCTKKNQDVKCGLCRFCKHGKCKPKPEMTACGTNPNRVCRSGACVACWTWTDIPDNPDLTACCRIDSSGEKACVAYQICQNDTCVECQAYCQGTCLTCFNSTDCANCRDQCTKTCAGPGANCLCNGLSCQPAPEQGDPNKYRCLP